MPAMTRRKALGVLGSVAVALHARGAAPPAQAPIEVANGLVVLPRDAWADGRLPTGPLPAEDDVRFLLVHHTASTNGADPITVIRSAYSFHTGPQKGWPDVAYNFFIDQFGVVWEGRAGSLDGPVQTSATGGSQGFAQLVCLLGDFTAELPTEAARSSLNLTLAWLAGRHEIVTARGSTTQFVSRGSNRWPAGTVVVASTISGHRDMSSTACPGDAFYPFLVENVAAQVSAIGSVVLNSTTATVTNTTTTVTSTAATSAVGVVEPTSSITVAPPSSGPIELSPTGTVVAGASTRSAPATIGSPGTSGPVHLPPTVFVTERQTASSTDRPSAVMLPGVALAAVAAIAGVALIARRRSQEQSAKAPSPPPTGESDQ